jgi:hypothetical protein
MKLITQRQSVGLIESELLALWNFIFVINYHIIISILEIEQNKFSVMSYSGHISPVLAFLIAVKIRIQIFSTKEVSSLLHIINISDPLFKCCSSGTESNFESFKYSDK